MRLSTILAPTLTVPVEVYGESLSVTWRPAALTPALEARVGDVADQPASAQTAVLVEVLSRLLAGWDLTEDDGSPVPTSVERLRDLPTAFLWAVYGGLSAEAAPKAPVDPPSDAGSTPTGN